MTNLEQLLKILKESEDLKTKLEKALEPFGEKNLPLPVLIARAKHIVRVVQIGNSEITS